MPRKNKRSKFRGTAKQFFPSVLTDANADDRPSTSRDNHDSSVLNASQRRLLSSFYLSKLKLNCCISSVKQQTGAFTNLSL